MTPTRSTPYLKYIRSLSCCVFDCLRRRIEAAHTGSHGMGQKSSDTQTVPLCDYHHRILHEIGPRRFEERYSLNLRQIVERLNAKPKITVEGGSFVARIERAEYVVGPVKMGFETALRKVRELWWEDRKDVANGTL